LEVTVTKVYVDMSMSLDGFVTASERSPEEPLGKGGERLHEWGFSEDADPRNKELMDETVAQIGAMITGRGNYEDSIKYWGPDGPTGEKRLPVFVVTHTPPGETSPDDVYTFVSEGLDATVEKAKDAADGKDVAVSGVKVSQQLIEEGLVDELSVHVVPVLFGGGSSLYDAGGEHIELEVIQVVATPEATHLRYRIVK
jgi:dihydrofolate reductase